MIAAVRKWIIAARGIDLLIVGLWLVAAALDFQSSGWGEGVYLRLTLAFFWFIVADTKIESRLRSNQVILTTPVEASADMRTAAHQVAQLRTALLAAGLTPDQASKQIADLIVASNDGAS